MKRKIFGNFVAFGLFFICAGMGVLWAQNAGFLLSGKLTPPPSWNGGYTDNIWFATGGALEVSDSQFKQVHYDSGGVLHGHFWIGMAGWTTFDHGVATLQARIRCQGDILAEKIEGGKHSLCPVEGFAWNENAGWISLNKMTTGDWRGGVSYNPNSANLEGFGWSEALGWVPIHTGKNLDFCEENPTDPKCQKCVQDPSAPECMELVIGDDDASGGLAVNFIGRVAVLGNIAGTRIFEIANAYGYTNQDVGYNYATIQHAPILNTIRGNVSQLVRNLKVTNALATTTPHQGFLYNTSRDYCIGNATNKCQSAGNFVFHLNANSLPNNTKTIIVKGKNVIIDADFNNSSANQAERNPSKMYGIIALKDENNNGGNIYITKNAKQIYAYMFAEGSIFSGERKTDGSYYKYIDDPEKVGNSSLPPSQLYINGIVISKNTIGGNAKNGDILSRCPVLVNDCDDTTATHFDWSYFRSYSSQTLGAESALPASLQGVNDTRVTSATVIIDYNSHIISEPPVGFESFQ